MNDIESIYEKLGISIRVSDKDRSNYTAYKWKKLQVATHRLPHTA